MTSEPEPTNHLEGAEWVTMEKFVVRKERDVLELNVELMVCAGEGCSTPVVKRVNYACFIHYNDEHNIGRRTTGCFVPERAEMTLEAIAESIFAHELGEFKADEAGLSQAIRKAAAQKQQRNAKNGGILVARAGQKFPRTQIRPKRH